MGRHGIVPSLGTLAIALVSHIAAAAEGQVAFPNTPAEVTQPAVGVVMTPAYAKTVARWAYVWGWPIVNMMNRRAAITKAPEPGRLNGVLPAAPGPDRHAERLHRPRPDLRGVQPGRSLRARLLFPR